MCFKRVAAVCVRRQAHGFGALLLDRFYKTAVCVQIVRNHRARAEHVASDQYMPPNSSFVFFVNVRVRCLLLNKTAKLPPGKIPGVARLAGPAYPFQVSS